MIHKIQISIFCSIGILLLILDPNTAMNGASEGVSLCLRVLIPSLFPFFILSVLLTDSIIGLSPGIISPITKSMRVPAGSESLFLIGLLSGYPVGAQCVYQSKEKGLIGHNDADRMMGFCSNAGPAFLFGMVAHQFPSSGYAWILWEILILSSILTGILLPGGNNYPIKIHNTENITVSEALNRSIKSISGVCGWVILFRVILTFLDKWFLGMLPQTLKVTMTLAMELANGCLALNEIDNLLLRFVLCAAGLSFGGLCVTMQTISVTAPDGIGMYLPGKIIQTCIATLLAMIVGLLMINGVTFIVISAIMLAIGIISILLSFFQIKKKKYSSNLITIGV